MEILVTICDRCGKAQEMEMSQYNDLGNDDYIQAEFEMPTPDSPGIGVFSTYEYVTICLDCKEVVADEFKKLTKLYKNGFDDIFPFLKNKKSKENN